MEIKRVTLVGLGAMGVFFAPKLQEFLGNTGFKVLAEGKRKERLEKEGVKINGKDYFFEIITPEEEGNPADLIIIAVKHKDLEQAINDVSRQVGEHTLIMSVMNGVDSEDRLIEVFGVDRVLYSYMKVSIVMKNNEANYDPKIGKVFFGEGKSLNRVGEYSTKVLAVQRLFEKAHIRYQIDEDMMYSIWYKFMSNMGENLTCALLGVPYIAFHRSEHANLIRNRAMEEVVAVAKAKGIGLSEKDIEMQNRFIEKLPAANIPSTLQDLEAGRKTEIEMFAGRMMEFGKEYGIPTPYCELFFHAIRVLEEKNEGCFLIES